MKLTVEYYFSFGFPAIFNICVSTLSFESHAQN